MAQDSSDGASFIHATALVSPQARLGKCVKIGPFCTVGEHVILENEVELVSHVCVDGRTTIGERTKIYPFASIGFPPQDLKYHGEPSELRIGTDNKIREYVTMQPGTEGGGMMTTIGNHCLFMAGAHVAHDCRIGNYVIMANYATLAGHVIIDDHAIIGGLSAVHQFVRIGAHAMIGGMSGIERDLIPYGTAIGERASLTGLNVIGLKRQGYSLEDIQTLQTAYGKIFGLSSGTLDERVQAVRSAFAENVRVQELVNFLTAPTLRSYCLPKDKFPSEEG
ncbi:MAG: acyl-ACP--UDP-N-acetylglucosamine O-acyltransferase [Holosporales bacterium]|jgi:UDP-N-acetylglucosamine acyltransferase|nr:acyl-ACP--UDP-N-acetylglucosamine O-acyltransferase [Holosporales bacterium]